MVIENDCLNSIHTLGLGVGGSLGKVLTAVRIISPRLAPAICGRKWTSCKCRLLIIIKCVN